MASTNTLTTKVASINRNSQLSSIARKYDLNINSVSWEDCSRNKNSCFGSNISDMTLAVANERSSYSNNLPAIRRPNFSDESSDLSIDNFSVTVGNERGSELKRISLKEYLQNISKYTVKNASQSENSKVKPMHLDRDSTILTSAQFCVLPLEDGECEFNVQLYNYQSSIDDPATLVVVVSSQGTSAQVVTNGTEKLCMNLNGRAANYLAKRLKDDRKEKGKALEGAMDLEEQERNALFVFQIPLKRKPRARSRSYYPECAMFSTNCAAPAAGSCAVPMLSMAKNMDDDIVEECDDSYAIPECQSVMFELEGSLQCASVSRSIAKPAAAVKKSRGMDNAVLRAGSTHSEFKGVGDYTLERDEGYPIRCTIQFYKVTDTDDIPEEAFQEMREKIDKVYRTGTAFGSLVVGGDTGRQTESVMVNRDVTTEQRNSKPMLAFFSTNTTTTTTNPVTLATTVETRESTTTVEHASSSS